MNRNSDTTEASSLDFLDDDIGPNLSFAASEAYKLLRTNLMFSLPGEDKKCRIVGVTSADAGEGKSTTSINLAYALAEADKRVILIEADMRLPSISKRLGFGTSPGLSNILAGQRDRKVFRHSGIHKNLILISAGDIPPNPSELLGSDVMERSMKLLSQEADFIVLDLPPIGEVSDALVVSRYTDGMLMIVRQNYANKRALSAAMLQLENVNAKVLGFVVTDSNSLNKGKYKYKKYKKGYGYGSKNSHNYADAISSEMDQ